MSVRAVGYFPVPFEKIDVEKLVRRVKGDDYTDRQVVQMVNRLRKLYSISLNYWTFLDEYEIYKDDQVFEGGRSVMISGNRKLVEFPMECTLVLADNGVWNVEIKREGSMEGKTFHCINLSDFIRVIEVCKLDIRYTPRFRKKMFADAIAEQIP